MQGTATVDRHFLSNAVATLRKMGVDIGTVCQRHGARNPLETSAERIPLSLVSPLYDWIAEETGDIEYVYRLSQQADPQGAGTLFELAVCCADLFSSLQLVCRYSSIASDAVAYRFRERGRHVDLLVVPAPNAYVSLHQVEAALYLPLLQYGRFVPPERQPLLERVFFSHAPRFPVDRYERYFGCPVKFGQPETGARLSLQALQTRLPGADERLERFHRSMAERYEAAAGEGDALPERVKRLFLQRMAFGEPDSHEIARVLAVSVRTLQRQLHEAGSSYRELAEEVRHAVARQELLSTSRPVHEIAFLLGYSDARAFRRAFQRWTGKNPASFRAKSHGK